MRNDAAQDPNGMFAKKYKDGRFAYDALETRAAVDLLRKAQRGSSAPPDAMNVNSGRQQDDESDSRSSPRHSTTSVADAGVRRIFQEEARRRVLTGTVLTVGIFFAYLAYLIRPAS